MFRNYLKTAWRNLWRSRSFSIINISGLAIGMAIAILIGLWIWDEVSFNKNFNNYERIVQVMHNWHDATDHEITTTSTMPIPAALELRNAYSSDFKYVALCKETKSQVLTYGNKAVSNKGLYAEPGLTHILSLNMVEGLLNGISNPSSIMISQSLANIIFGHTNPIDKVIKIDNKKFLTVTGIYKDFPYNSTFYGVNFLIPWTYLVEDRKWVKDAYDQWNNNSFVLYAQLADHSDIHKVSTEVKDLLKGKPDRNDNPQVILQPMSKWHLYSEFKNGKNVGGNIVYVRLFGIIGLFVLLLACINFMNLSTARSEKRAREVGVRKAIGSMKRQLVFQFLSESVLITFIAMLTALVLVQLALPWFNHVASKAIKMPWDNGLFWLMIIVFTFFTGLLSGSYPAFYLSSFNPVKVLKGTFKAGPYATVPRKALVILQFTVSVSLIIGVIIIFQQIQFTKNRPLGYNQNGLITIPMTTPDFYGKYDLLRRELISSGAVVNMAEASNSPTDIDAHLIGFDWPGKNPDLNPIFSVSWVTHDFGKTVGWDFEMGRDFQRNFSTDTSGMILNEKAVSFMGLRKPIGQTIKFGDKNFHVIGVIKNVVMESPFVEAMPTAFMMDYENVSVITIKINPLVNMQKALLKIKSIFEKYIPDAPFNYTFVDEDYAKKFSAEQRLGTLSGFFALFAIFISCLGIFGLASFMTEQRKKEIGIRKTLGATVISLWRLLTKEFLMLVLISFCIATPLSWYFMHNWLQRYEYRTHISAKVFFFTAILIIIITVVTVSWQAIRAARANPVKSLRSE